MQKQPVRVFGSQSFLKTPRQQLSLCCHLTCQALNQHHSPPSPHCSARSDLPFQGWAEPVGPAQPRPVSASSSVVGFLLPYSHLSSYPCTAFIIQNSNLMPGTLAPKGAERPPPCDWRCRNGSGICPWVERISCVPASPAICQGKSSFSG